MGSNTNSFTDWIKSSIGLSMLMIVYYGSIAFIILMIFGSNFTRIILILIYIYQLFFASKSKFYKDLCAKFQPYNYFTENDTIYEEEISDKKNLIAFHPHGMMGITIAFNELRATKLKDFHFLVSRGIFTIPIGGLFGKWYGLEGVNNENFKNLMKKGENIGFLPGGFEEATITDPNQDKVFVKNRKGFIKYGMQYGYNLFPSYTFNENKMFHCVTMFEKFRLFLNSFKIPAVIFWGKYGLFPNPNLKLYTVIGKKIELPFIKEPSKEDIDKYHGLYVQELENIFNKHKNNFGGSSTLTIY